MASSYLPSAYSATQRRSSQTSDNPITAGPLYPGLVPAPNPRPIFQFLAFGLFILLGLLQLLPATHFRDPFDPSRNWVPLHSNLASPLREFDARNGDGGGDDGMVHVVSWMDCLDLRVLAVLANSTLSSSSYPELVSFHFFIPGGNEDKVPFYKLKVLFPHSNLEIHGQEEVKEIVRIAFSDEQYAKPRYEEIVPFIIPTVHQFLSKFIYVSANVIMKARVEELIGVDLDDYAIATAEDCSQRLKTYVNSEVLDAIQRSVSKPWVSETPYAKDTCLPDLSVLVINARKLGKDIVETVLWWSKALNLRERTDQKNLALALALYNRYLKLSSSWLVKDITSPEVNNSMIIYYDGPKTSCIKSISGAASEYSHGNVWTQYLPSISDRILGS
ncbi:hypothetical protein POPTR_001G081100v4 [Populus trichocarpa]|uniref:Hexosyltransferase n=1 Tax=Populus trichocarpa TaxID=3694 RepID=B9GK46_POPTR|nr:uncharacterized protein LOC7459823 isoform X1 [Populus trichocarpa]PNT53360.1 hypothetical protein POPTR_001G081100v4 [Populus trichocarpa]|eukprot:XP_002297932.1 uncharacterized protein LOC7459823 [Populus trichocarpa]